jgi:hypothetical protein
MFLWNSASICRRPVIQPPRSAPHALRNAAQTLRSISQILRIDAQTLRNAPQFDTGSFSAP